MSNYQMGQKSFDATKYTNVTQYESYMAQCTAVVFRLHTPVDDLFVLTIHYK